LGSEGINPDAHSLFTDKYTSLIHHPAFKAAESAVASELFPAQPKDPDNREKRKQRMPQVSPDQMKLDF